MGIRKDHGAAGGRRKLWIVLFLVPCVIVLAAAITLKVVFTSERLKAMVIPRLEQATGRSVMIGDIDLSLFPSLAVRIDSLAVSNREGQGFSRSPFLSLDRLELKVRLSALFRGNLEITTMVLDHPDLLLEVNAKGVANYSQMPEARQAAAENGVPPLESDRRDSLVAAPEGGMLLFSDMRIVNGSIRYLNRKDSSSIVIRGLNHVMRMEIEGTSKNAVIEGQTSIESLSYGSLQKPLISNLHLTASDQIAYDKAHDSLMIRRGEISVQNIALTAAGSVAGVTGNPALHLVLQSQRARIPDLLSLVPGEYMKQAEGARGEGVADIRMTIEGAMNDSSTPAISGSISASGASLQYPGLPKPISDIRIACSFVRSVSTQELRVEQFSATLGANPFAVTLLATNFSDPAISLSVNATLNLSEVKEYYPLPEGTTLGGTVAGKLSVAGNIRTPGAMAVEGSMTFHRVAIASSASATPIRDLDGTVTLKAQTMESKKLALMIGTSDLALSFSVSNILSLLSSDKAAPKPVAQLSVVSRHLSTADIMADTATARTPAPTPRGSQGRPAEQPPAHTRGGVPLPTADLHVTASIGTLTMERFEFKNVRAALRVHDAVMTLENFSLAAFDGSATAQGTLDLQHPEQPMFDLALTATNMDAHALLPKFTSFGDRLYGRLTMTTTLKGNLDDTLGLVPPSLNGQGHVRMTNGKLTGMQTNKTVADMLKLPDLENIAFKDWSNDFSVSNGRIVIKDLTIHALDADYVVNGSQGIDGTLDYAMSLLLPPRTAAQASIPGFGGEAINLFRDESGRVKLDFTVKGTTDKPSVSLDTQPALRKAGELAKQKAQEEAKKLQDQAKKKAGDALKNLFRKKN